jgi:hypothetical protein
MLKLFFVGATEPWIGGSPTLKGANTTTSEECNIEGLSGLEVSNNNSRHKFHACSSVAANTHFILTTTFRAFEPISLFWQ